MNEFEINESKDDSSKDEKTLQINIWKIAI